ncbi:hypothetical protein V0288_24835 [Pannus brasiliensis CCIBt3594]|uniref:Uncharacterized protein n=1 Tax=Pannus brasiliensis CCIBt3594 TaxID=1427578 RepID=A0AAW9R086_9CHRO
MTDFAAFCQEYGEMKIPLSLTLDQITEIIGTFNTLDQLCYGDDTNKTAFLELRETLENQVSRTLPRFRTLLDREMEMEMAEPEKKAESAPEPPRQFIPIEGTPAVDVKAFLDKYKSRPIELKIDYADVFNLLVSLNRDVTFTCQDDLEKATLLVLREALLSQTVRQFPECYSVHFKPISPVGGGNDVN